MYVYLYASLLVTSHTANIIGIVRSINIVGREDLFPFFIFSFLLLFPTFYFVVVLLYRTCDCFVTISHKRGSPLFFCLLFFRCLSSFHQVFFGCPKPNGTSRLQSTPKGFFAKVNRSGERNRQVNSFFMLAALLEAINGAFPRKGGCECLT